MHDHQYPKATPSHRALCVVHSVRATQANHEGNLRDAQAKPESFVCKIVENARVKHDGRIVNVNGLKHIGIKTLKNIEDGNDLVV